jgi:Zn-dependent protease
MNAIARSIGSSVAAALVAVLLSRGHSDYPQESSFTVIFALGAATGIVAIGLIAVSRPGLRPIRSIEDLAKSRAMNHEWG